MEKYLQQSSYQIFFSLSHRSFVKLTFDVGNYFYKCNSVISLENILNLVRLDVFVSNENDGFVQ